MVEIAINVNFIKHISISRNAKLSWNDQQATEFYTLTFIKYVNIYFVINKELNVFINLKFGQIWEIKLTLKIIKLPSPLNMPHVNHLTF